MKPSNIERKQLVESLYRRYWFQVERHCNRMLNNEEDARDAAQEAFLALLTHADKFRFEAEWMTWLHRVSTNICLNRLKYNKIRHRGWRSDVQKHSYPGTEDEFEDRVFWLSIFKRTLSQNDEPIQKVAIEYFVNDRTQCEISSLIGISRPTVKKRIEQFLFSARRFYSSLTCSLP